MPRQIKRLRYLMLWFLASTILPIFHQTSAAPVLAQSTPQTLNQNQNLAVQNYQAAREAIAAGSLFVAKPKLQQSLKIYQNLNNAQGQYQCLVELARIDYLEGKYRQAQFKLRQGSQVIGYSNHDAQAKTLEGLIALELGDYFGAFNRLHVSVSQLKTNITHDRLGRQIVNDAQIALGEVYFYRGLYSQGENQLHQALRVARQPASRRKALNVLGEIQLEIGQYQEALTTFEQAAGVANTPGDRLGKAKTLENLGKAYQVLGNKKLALKQYQLALNSLKSIGAWGKQVYVLNNLGLLAMDLGLTNRALEYFQLAENSLSNSGGAGQVNTYINLGFYFSQRQQYSKAVDYLESALSWARSNGDRIGEAKALSGLGALEFQKTNYADASRTLETSIAILESLRPGLRDEQKISLAESHKRTYDLLQQAYVNLNLPAQALVAAERSRARAFVELLAQRNSAKLPTEFNLEPPSLSEIQEIAQNRQATLVNYSIIEDQLGAETLLYIWVINPQGEITLRQLELTAIKEQFRTSVASVSQNSREAAAGGLDLRNPRLQDYVVAFRGDVNADSVIARRKLGFPRDAYKLLIEPIKDLLPLDPEQLVVFIPQSSLFLVPFPALQNNAGEFLIEQHSLQIAPSIQTLSLQKPSQNLSITNPLIVGNPAPMPENLSPLTGAEQEAQAIASILETTPIIGESATEAFIVEQMEQASLIHLATHGLFDEHQGLQSSLAFSSVDNQEGFLTAGEILDLNLKADLVVLSACNTGRGKITGDGVVGLSRSFLLAGAQTTMVSLWDVPDISTSMLMTDFYRQLQQNPSQPQALRQAMLNTMEQYPSPRNWAAFMLVGQ